MLEKLFNAIFKYHPHDIFNIAKSRDDHWATVHKFIRKYVFFTIIVGLPRLKMSSAMTHCQSGERHDGKQ